MKSRDLRIGDTVRIIGVPGEGIPDYFIHRETVRVYKKLTARMRPVRIREIDEYGQPWFWCRFRRKNGTFELHALAIMDTDTNWELVKRRVP